MLIKVPPACRPEAAQNELIKVPPACRPAAAVNALIRIPPACRPAAPEKALNKIPPACRPDAAQYDFMTYSDEKEHKTVATESGCPQYREQARTTSQT